MRNCFSISANCGINAHFTLFLQPSKLLLLTSVTRVARYELRVFIPSESRRRRNAFNTFLRASFYVASEFVEFHMDASSHFNFQRVRAPICSRAALRNEPTNSDLNAWTKLSETSHRAVRGHARPLRRARYQINSLVILRPPSAFATYFVPFSSLIARSMNTKCDL